MVRTIAAFLDFCYLARRDIHTKDSLAQMEEALKRFRRYREVFREEGVRTGNSAFSLPRQHSLEHYVDLIWDFGAPNGVCTSITESKHIKAVKEPWRRSNRYEAIGQMLKTNERLDKLSASRVDFAERGMLDMDTSLEPGVLTSYTLFVHTDRGRRCF